VQSSSAGVPLRVHLDGAWREVKLLRKPWRVEQGWWRAQPVDRVYYRLAADDGSLLTIYHDNATGEWARQEY
jgi:hypothetical protein